MGSRGRGKSGKQRVESAPGQGYGERTKQEIAQRAVPLPQEPGTSVAPVPAGVRLPPTREIVPLTAPTQRPDEPVTAGLSIGAGPGPEALGPLAPGARDVVAELRGLFAAHPNEDVRRLLEFAERRVRPAQTGFK